MGSSIDSRKVQLVIGHMGETLPFMLPRLDVMPMAVTKLNRPISAYLRENVHYTFSGFNVTPTFLELLLHVGVDRIMFSADYPCIRNNGRQRGESGEAARVPAYRRVLLR